MVPGGYVKIAMANRVYKLIYQVQPSSFTIQCLESFEWMVTRGFYNDIL